MKKRLLSILLAMMMALSILPTTSLAASSVEEALGEIDIYNGGTELSYLMINGRVRTLIYTYYNYVNAKGETREIPAYCVNPNITGVPQTVGVGESIEYLAEEKTSDPKVLGIVANGYPTRSLEELGLENKKCGKIFCMISACFVPFPLHSICFPSLSKAAISTCSAPHCG